MITNLKNNPIMKEKNALALSLENIFFKEKFSRLWDGRSHRTEFWSVVATLIIVSAELLIPQYLLFDSMSDALLAVCLLIDALWLFFSLWVFGCLYVRRMRDAGLPLSLLSLVNSLAIVSMLCCKHVGAITAHNIIGSAFVLFVIGCCMAKSTTELSRIP